MSLSPALRPCSPAPLAQSGAASLGHILAAGLVRPFAALRLHWQRQNLRAELASLDYRELKDLGITDLDGFVAGWHPQGR